jgi:hypothetical protein
MSYITLGDNATAHARDCVTFPIRGDHYPYTIDVSHPIHTHHLREQMQVRRYYLLDPLWKLLRDIYARRREQGAEHTSTEIRARQATLVVVLRELLESGAGISVGG